MVWIDIIVLAVYCLSPWLIALLICRLALRAFDIFDMLDE